MKIVDKWSDGLKVRSIPWYGWFVFSTAWWVVAALIISWLGEFSGGFYLFAIGGSTVLGIFFLGRIHTLEIDLSEGVATIERNGFLFERTKTYPLREICGVEIDVHRSRKSLPTYHLQLNRKGDNLPIQFGEATLGPGRRRCYEIEELVGAALHLYHTEHGNYVQIDDDDSGTNEPGAPEQKRRTEADAAR